MTSTDSASPPDAGVDDIGYAARTSPSSFLEEHSRLRRTMSFLSFRNISCVYVLLALLALFAVTVGSLFYTSSNFTSILYEQCVTALVAVAAVLPFSAGVFDASLGGTVGIGSILSAVLMAYHHVPWLAAVALTVGAGATIGVVNALIITGLGVDPIIATLGMLSILTGVGSAIGHDNIVSGLPATFSNLGTDSFLGVGYPVWAMLAIALAAWYVLEHTVAGRHIYATGGNSDTARLAGVHTKRVITGAVIAAGAVAAFAGVVATARDESGQSDIGPPYLLPTFAAVFLGATQFKNGRFNVWGAVLATYLLGAGVDGFILLGAPLWTPDVFDGVALILAVSLTVRRTRGSGGSRTVAGGWRRGSARWVSRRFLARMSGEDRGADVPGELGAGSAEPTSRESGDP